MNLGYACINMTLSASKPKITTNRSMIKRTFLEKGIDYAGELSLQNARDLHMKKLGVKELAPCKFCQYPRKIANNKGDTKVGDKKIKGVKQVQRALPVGGIKYRKIGLVILFSIITFGIYTIYWLISTSNSALTNLLLLVSGEGLGEEKSSLILQICK